MIDKWSRIAKRSLLLNKKFAAFAKKEWRGQDSIFFSDTNENVIIRNINWTSYDLTQKVNEKLVEFHDLACLFSDDLAYARTLLRTSINYPQDRSQSQHVGEDDVSDKDVLSDFVEGQIHDMQYYQDELKRLEDQVRPFKAFESMLNDVNIGDVFQGSAKLSAVSSYKDGVNNADDLQEFESECARYGKELKESLWTLVNSAIDISDDMLKLLKMNTYMIDYLAGPNHAYANDYKNSPHYALIKFFGGFAASNIWGECRPDKNDDKPKGPEGDIIPLWPTHPLPSPEPIKHFVTYLLSK